MCRPFYRHGPLLLGALFILAAISKLLHPGPATVALESLRVPTIWAKAIVATVTSLELYLGAVLMLKVDLRYALIFSTFVLFVFTAYLFYLSTLAHPPSCGCLGLMGIFQNSRQEALLGLARNCALLWAIKWTYDRHFPNGASSSGTHTDTDRVQSLIASP